MRAVFIAGGAGGLGGACAKQFVAHGWAVTIADRDADNSAAAAAALGPDSQCLGLECDVTDSGSVNAAIAASARQFGSIDCLINAAGIAHPSPVDSITDADWEELTSIHIDGTMRACRAAMPFLEASPQASVVNLSSMNSQLGVSGRLSYCAAKGAVESMTRVLAVEWAGLGIRVNAVAPGYVETAMLAKLIEDGDHDLHAMLRRIPMGRLGSPREIADLIYFLASESASYITGQVLVADGGRTVNGDL